MTLDANVSALLPRQGHALSRARRGARRGPGGDLAAGGRRREDGAHGQARRQTEGFGYKVCTKRSSVFPTRVSSSTCFNTDFPAYSDTQRI